MQEESHSGSQNMQSGRFHAGAEPQIRVTSFLCGRWHTVGGDSRAPVLGTVSLTTNRLIPAQGLYLKSGEFDLDNLHGLFLIDAVGCSRAQ